MPIENTPDNLLPRIAVGDQQAVQDCIDRYGGLVWSLARRLCPDRTEAEDAVQEVFVSLWKSAARFDPELGSEATFVATIARRRLIDRTRRASRRPDTSVLDENLAGAPTPPDPPAVASMSQSEETRIASSAMAELSEDQQRVLRLSIIYGLSHEKIAQATDLPLGTVKTHIRRGLIRVRQLLAERQARAADASADGPSGVAQ